MRDADTEQAAEAADTAADADAEQAAAAARQQQLQVLHEGKGDGGVQLQGDSRESVSPVDHEDRQLVQGPRQQGVEQREVVMVGLLRATYGTGGGIHRGCL